MKTTAFSADNLAAKYSKGKVQKLAPVVTWNGKKLNNKSDLVVTYPEEGNAGAYSEAGKYTVKITGQGNFTGERVISLEITADNLITKAKFSKVSNYPYDEGNAIMPAVTVTMGKATLTKGVDYEIAYENNREVGTAAVIITGKGTYSGVKRINFKITGEKLNSAKVENLVDKYYTGEGVIQDCRLYVVKNKQNIYLTEGKDYQVSYTKNVTAGTANIVFTGINKYKGTSLKKSFKIKPYDMYADVDNKLTVTYEDTVPYAKGGSMPKVTVMYDGQQLVEGTDYKVAYKENKKVTALAKKVPTITVTGKGNYSGTALSEDFTIEKQDLGNLNITVADKVYQNKKNIYKTTVTITDLDGKKLSAGSDYDKNMVYTYSNQTELADGTIKAAGAEVTANDIIPANTMITVTVKYLEKGSYVGEISGEYRIIPADIKGAKTTVDPQIYTGKEIELTEEDITVTMKGYTLSPDEFEIVDGSYKNHVKKGTASVTIKATSENYGGTKSVSFKIVSKSIFW